MTMTKALKRYLIDNNICPDSLSDESLYSKAAAAALIDGTLSTERFDELQKSVTPNDVFGNVRVKKPGERYSTTKSTARHTKSGNSVMNWVGEETQNPSQLEHAKAGVLFKKAAQRGGLPVALSEHETALWEETLEDNWCGKLGSEYLTGIPGSQVKTILNDSLSGGADIVPEWFDANIVTYPLLHSEILPGLTLIDISRGSHVSSGSISNLSATWGISEGTSLTPFDTASLIDAIDTTIHNVSISIEFGADFISDSPVEVGKILTELAGQRLYAELDRVAVKGNGITEPLGIFNTSGMNDIGNPAGGAGAVAQVDDMESLMFGIGKQYRNPIYRPVFLSNDITYKRVRAIPVGASDERRVFGMSHGDYKVFDWPYKISQDLGNAYCGYGALAKYKMYRRMGMSLFVTREGRELALKNQVLMCLRGRYGGKLCDPSSWAFSDNFQA